MILNPVKSLAPRHFDQPSHPNQNVPTLGTLRRIAPEVSWLVGLSHPLAEEYHSDSFAIKDCEPVPALGHHCLEAPTLGDDSVHAMPRFQLSRSACHVHILSTDPIHPQKKLYKTYILLTDSQYAAWVPQ